MEERFDISREARVVGLREFSTPSLEDVEKRRWQLWTVAIVVMGVLALCMVVLSFDMGVPGGFRLARMGAFRVGVVLVVLAFAAYVLEKEVHLRRLTEMLVDERVLTAALSNRLKELATLATVGKAVNSVLELEQVLDIILSSATELLQGTGGSVMLLEGTEELRAVCVQGNVAPTGSRVRLGEGVAGQVAADGQPLLIEGPADPERFSHLVERQTAVVSAVSVPLTHRGNLLGVLNVNGGERPFTEYDLRALTLFAEHAATAIANARLFEMERSHVEELVELDRLKSEFVATVSHELRTPLTSILASTQTLQRRPLGTELTDEFLVMIERQGRKLLRLIEDILDIQHTTAPDLECRPVELAPLVHQVVQLECAAGRDVSVSPLDGLVVQGDAGALERILINLIDNAHIHGGGQPLVEARAVDRGRAPMVRLSVLDRGPGVPPDEVEHVFDRFGRGSTTTATGMGLGLYLVRTLAEAQDGFVDVADREGGGAAFHVFLPVPA